MSNIQAINRIETSVNAAINTLEFLSKELSALKKEFKDGGASANSARKGSLSDDEKKNIRMRLKKKRIKKAT